MLWKHSLTSNLAVIFSAESDNHRRTSAMVTIAQPLESSSCSFGCGVDCQRRLDHTALDIALSELKDKGLHGSDSRPVSLSRQTLGLQRRATPWPVQFNHHYGQD